jgi:hypothetical protein
MNKLKKSLRYLLQKRNSYLLRFYNVSSAFSPLSTRSSFNLKLNPLNVKQQKFKKYHKYQITFINSRNNHSPKRAPHLISLFLFSRQISAVKDHVHDTFRLIQVAHTLQISSHRHHPSNFQYFFLSQKITDNFFLSFLASQTSTTTTKRTKNNRFLMIKSQNIQHMTFE